MPDVLIRDDPPLYGASMSKGVTSCLFGRAFCEGLAHSLDDPVEKFAPALAGTFYGRVAIRDALDMTAGDRALYSNSPPRVGGDTNRDYNFPVLRQGVPVVEALRGFGVRDRARGFA